MSQKTVNDIKVLELNKDSVNFLISCIDNITREVSIKDLSLIYSLVRNIETTYSSTISQDEEAQKISFSFNEGEISIILNSLEVSNKKNGLQVIANILEIYNQLR